MLYREEYVRIMITKKEIADYLGVSRTAVSLVLNNSQKSKVSEETRNKILKAAKDLGYRNNNGGRKLCYILYNRDPDDPRYMITLRYIEEESSKHGYNLVFMNIHSKIDGFKKLEKYLEMKEAEGYILTGDVDDDIIHALEIFEVPYLVLGADEKENINSVAFDAEKGAYKATKLLIEKGHKKIALFTGRLDIIVHKQNYSGYKKAFEDYGILFDKSLVQVSNNEDGYELVDRMEMLDIEYTAAFCVNTVIQFGAVQRLKEKGVDVPGKISLIGQGYSELVKISNPPLTTFTYDFSKSAEIIIERLVKITNSANEKPQKLTFDYVELYEGGTISICKNNV